jgi:beta-N-acetylhexosaminidase
MHGRGRLERDRLHEQPRWHEGVHQVAQLEDLATLDLDLTLALDDPTNPDKHQ